MKVQDLLTNDIVGFMEQFIQWKTMIEFTVEAEADLRKKALSAANSWGPSVA